MKHSLKMSQTNRLPRNINIFGVGRSGTKAVQLWVTYALAQQYSSVWINYEPFSYKTRKLQISNRGRLIDRSTPLFISEDYQPAHELCHFLSDLSNHRCVVTKFIRGNGRIKLINRLMNADFSILVVRDLYDVLGSILLQNWSLVRNDKEWKTICVYAENKYPFLKKFDFVNNSGSQKIVRNAVYWFVMNMYAIENLRDTVVISISSEEGIYKLENLFPLKGLSATNRFLFDGNNIHKDFPLKDMSQMKDPTRAVALVNRGLFKLTALRACKLISS